MKLLKKFSVILLTFAFILTVFSACGSKEKADLFSNAIYKENVTLGEGDKTVTCDVKVNDKTVTFTVNTNAHTVGAALLDNGIISGEEGPYGLYVKVVNGITADYDIDQSYWAFYIDGEYAMSGIDLTPINENARYSLEYTK